MSIRCNLHTGAPRRSLWPSGCLSVKLVRPLDGIAYALASTLFFLVHPGLRTTPLGELSNLYVLPFACVVLSVFFLPGRVGRSVAYESIRWRLRLAGLAALGLCPFVAWWLRARLDMYLMAVAALGLLAAIWFLQELAALLCVLTELGGDEMLRRRAGIARLLLMFVLMAPVIAIAVTFAAALAVNPAAGIFDVKRWWRVIPVGLQVAMLLPIVETWVILWLTRRLVARQADTFAAAPAVQRIGRAHT